MAFSYTTKNGKTFYLHKKEFQLKSSQYLTTIHYFSKSIGENVLDSLPDGFEVVEAGKNNFPFVRKIK